MLKHDGEKNTPLWRLAVDYEMARGNFTEREVIDKMIHIVRILRRSIQSGIAGTHYEDRVLGYQSGRFNELMQSGKLLDGGTLNRIVLYVTALMEVKSSMGVIVAAPTAGACAALPGAVIGMAEALDKDEEEMAKAVATGVIDHGVGLVAHWSREPSGGGKGDGDEGGPCVQSHTVGRGNGDGSDEDGGSVVDHALGERGGDDVNNSQCERWIFTSDEALGNVCDGLGGTGFLLGNTQRQDTGEHDKHAPVHRAVGLIGRQ